MQEKLKLVLGNN